MDSHAVSSPTILGPLSSMFSQEAHDAILAEERAELQQQQIDIDAMQAATAVDSSIAETSVVTEVLGPVGLPVQQLPEVQLVVDVLDLVAEYCSDLINPGNIFGLLFCQAIA